MRPHPEHRLGDSQTGFTIIELIIVIVVVGILSAYAAMRGGLSSSELSLPSQAEKMASDIRRAQALAYTSGKRVRLTVAAGANGTYAVACVTVPTPCGTDFSVTLQKDVILGGTASLEFTSLGQPSAAASYTLAYPANTNTKTIAVAALTGIVTVTP
ncbi:MAG: prepilin-type N-terminal cleavage/methylation domain-containing protein [Acidobacteriota bacterium]